MNWLSTLRWGALLSALGVAAALVQWLPEREAIGTGFAIDGDSLRIGDRELRLKGIDAPEYRQTCQSGAGEVACGRDARRALAALLERSALRCRLLGRDRYRRELAVCRVGDVDVNAAMVRDGHAVAFGDYEAEEREARAARRGVWALTFEKPSVWREKHPRGAGTP